jgi:hypothetical protein
VKSAAFISSISSSGLRRHLSCVWILNLILYFFLMLEESVNAFQSSLYQTLGFVKILFCKVNHFKEHLQYVLMVKVSYF